MIMRVREKPKFLEGVDNLRGRREAKGKDKGKPDGPTDPGEVLCSCF